MNYNKILFDCKQKIYFIYYLLMVQSNLGKWKKSNTSI